VVRHRSSGTRPAVREHQRVVVTLSGCCCVQGRPSLPGLVTDLSLGGAFFEASGQLPLGTALVLELSHCVGPSKTAPLRLPATIRWSNDRGFGVQFSQLAADDAKELIRLVCEAGERQAVDGGRASGF
jgi:hypothetical protein